jgi:biofilm protein TabA
MILDVLDNSDRYLALHKGFIKAFAFLRRADLKDLPMGRYEVDGDRVYAMVATEAGRRKEDALLEAHEQYIDIQLVLAGVDEMGWKATLTCTQPSGAYDREADVRFFADAPDAWIATHPGAFVIFFPEDGHMPLISSAAIHKVVVKIAASQG